MFAHPYSHTASDCSFAPPTCLPALGAVSLSALQKFGMTDHATFGVSFESNDLFVPAVEKKAQASKKLQEADDSSSNKPGHVLKSLLPAGEHSSDIWEGFRQGVSSEIGEGFSKGVFGFWKGVLEKLSLT